ncbi:MAG: histone deacetylase family protein [Brevinematia bacterium]
MESISPANKVGIFYNPFLEKHLENVYHIEQPLRTKNTYKKLQELLSDRVKFFISNERISVETIERVHDKHYVEKILSFSDLKEEVFLDPDTVVAENSVDCAILSASLVCMGIREVIEGNLNSAFVLSRPPGHHATKNQAMGFCIFNNIAIGAQMLIDEYNISRIAIVDFDVHHGNGTQDIFYTSDKVLYISTHRYPFYPGTGYFNQIGRGDGLGFNVNIPLPEGAGDNEFSFVYTEIIRKILKKFEPEIILVSAGFDAHYSDPLGGMTLTEKGFRQIINSILLSSPNGKVVLALEGGYNVNTLPSVIYEVIEEMIRPSDKPLLVPQPSITVEEVLENFLTYINNYWNIL